MSKLIKHSAAIQLSGSLTLAQRQTYNALLKQAFPWMERGEDHWIQVRMLEEVLGKRNSRNRAWLIDTAESLRDVSVRYNIFGKDRSNRDVWEMHSGLVAEIGVKSNRELIKYSFPNTLVDLLRQPSMYAKINLDVQARFRGHYGLPLYEFYLDMLGGKRKEVEYTFWIEDLRRLLCIEGKHTEFKHLQNKVIKPAHLEINEHTDIGVSVIEHLRENRKVVALKLHLEHTGLGQPLDQLPESGSGDSAVKRALESFYDTATVAMILNRYSVDYIQAQLEYLEERRGKEKIRNPAAYLRSLIQANHAGFGKSAKGVIVEGPKGQGSGPSEKEAADRARKAAEKRWAGYCEEEFKRRYAEFDEDEVAAIQVRFEHSELYQNSPALHRGTRESGFYKKMLNTFVFRELCPEPRFHDLEAFLAWEGEEEGPEGKVGASAAG